MTEKGFDDLVLERKAMFESNFRYNQIVKYIKKWASVEHGYVQNIQLYQSILYLLKEFELDTKKSLLIHRRILQDQRFFLKIYDQTAYEITSMKNWICDCNKILLETNLIKKAQATNTNPSFRMLCLQANNIQNQIIKLYDAHLRLTSQLILIRQQLSILSLAADTLSELRDK